MSHYTHYQVYNHHLPPTNQFLLPVQSKYFLLLCLLDSFITYEWGCMVFVFKFLISLSILSLSFTHIATDVNISCVVKLIFSYCKINTQRKNCLNHMADPIFSLLRSLHTVFLSKLLQFAFPLSFFSLYTSPNLLSVSWLFDNSEN